MCTSLSHTPNTCVSNNKSTTTISNSTVNSSNSISIDSHKLLANNNNYVKRSETKEMCTSPTHTPNSCVSNNKSITNTNKSTTTISNSTLTSSNSISIDSHKLLAYVKRSETKEMWKRLLTKLTSSKLWLTAWACFLITFIVMSGLTEFFGIALALCSVPLSYFAVNEIQKYLQNK